MSEKLLACTVFPGMFSDELAVMYKRKDNQSGESSFFVPRDRVRGEGSNQGSIGMLQVNVFHDGNAMWAVLPNENQTVIEVDECDLR
jgi:hypothetical protein